MTYDHGDGSYDPNTGMPRKTADESYDFDGNPKMGGASSPGNSDGADLFAQMTCAPHFCVNRLPR